MKTEQVEVCGKLIRIDESGVGHNWKPATYIPESIQEEIAAEIIDGKQEECDDYTATNGLHYRW